MSDASVGSATGEVKHMNATLRRMSPSTSGSNHLCSISEMSASRAGLRTVQPGHHEQYA